MKHRLYKVWIGRGDGVYARFLCKNNLSQWLSKVDADACIASGIGVRKNGPSAPYYAILDIEAVSGDIPRPENAVIYGAWRWPSNGVLILSTEAKREGILKIPNAAVAPSPAKPIPAHEPTPEPVQETIPESVPEPQSTRTRKSS